VTYTSVRDYMIMPLYQIRDIREATIEVLRAEREAAARRK